MADVWSWVIGYAILFALVQLIIYAYYVRRGDGAPSATGVGDPDQQLGDRIDRDPLVENDVDHPNDLDDLDGNDPISPTDTDGRACPHCGTPNKDVTTVRYCRNCTRSLG